MKTILTYLSLLLLCSSATAAMRVWTDRQGNLVEGEYVRMGSNNAVVRDEQGVAHDIPLKGLSTLELEYLTSVFVPDVSINFSKKTRAKYRSENALPGDHVEYVIGRISIKAQQKMENNTLRAEAYLIGAEVASDDYRIKSKVAPPLSFTAANKFTAEFQLEMESREYQEYNFQIRGTLYDGYLVVVLNQRNEVIEYKTNLSWLDEEKIALLRKFRVDAFFDDDCKARSVPRPEYTESRVGGQ